MRSGGVVNEQALPALDGSETHAGDSKTVQLSNGWSGEGVVQYDPGLISELQISVCLYQYTLPVTYLGLDRHESLERRRSKAGDGQ